MIIGIYNPYLDSLAGGERYVATLASHWSNTHEVRIFWDNNDILNLLSKRFKLNLLRVKTTQNIFRGINILNKILLTRQYDLLFILSDGSIPTTFARFNILHFQVPFEHIKVSAFKLDRYQAIVCNSQYTCKHLDNKLQSRAQVIYPPVDINSWRIGKKEKLIVSVGRFSSHNNAKKQEVLIEAIRLAQMNKKLSGWHLLLAGGLLSSDTSYLEKLKQLARNLPISFIPNIDFNELTRVYAKASIYWHAAGFNETEPKHMEHFGMTTVEAMASGCIPIVYNDGGQPEIIDSGSNGYLWRTPEELIQHTEYFINNPTYYIRIQQTAIQKSKHFSVELFCLAYDKLLETITS